MDDASQNTGEYNSLQNVQQIDPAVLNTPAQEPNSYESAIPDRSVETYFNLNKPQQQQNPQGDVILDLDGKQVQVRDDQAALETKSELLNEVYGTNAAVEEEANTGAAFVFVLIIVGLTIFIMINLKRSEHMLNLEKELKRLKDDSRFRSF